MSTTDSDVVLWLIEHPNNGNQRPFYWGNEEGEQGWTGDIEASFKFETSDEADRHAGDVGIPDYKIIDHKWLNHKPTTKSVVDEPVNLEDDEYYRYVHDIEHSRS